MSFSGRSLYILLWALTPLISLLVYRYSQYPNQLYWGYKLFLVILALLIFRDSVKIISVQLRWLGLVSLYAFSFIAVSYFGVDFTTSVQSYHVLYKPLILLDFFVSFVVGYKYHENQSMKYVLLTGGIILVYAIADVWITPDKTRLISGLEIPMAIPAAVIFGNTFIALVMVVFLFASMKKTVAACGLVSFGLAFFLKKVLRLRGWAYGRSLKKEILEYVAARKFLIFFLALLIAVVSPPYIFSTIERFSSSYIDTTRVAITSYSFQLLYEYFPGGIGLGGFSFLSLDSIPYQITDARGVVRSGANLHSSFMTWALEGGALVLLVVTVIFLYLVKIIRRFLIFDNTKYLGAILLVWLVAGMIFGLFQQWHNTGAFWLLFGYSFGCYERYRATK